MDNGAVRNLEQIQESDESTRMPRGLSLALMGLGGACIAFAVLAIGGRKTGSAEKRPDPLGDLVAQRAKAPGSSSIGGPSMPPAAALSQLTAKDVTFPSILSDGARPTTALAAVRSPAPPSSASPLAGDRLPVVTFAHGTPPIPHDDTGASVGIATPSTPTLPAQNLLEATPVVMRPRDPLTRSANESAQMSSSPAASVPSGHEGGWQLQVSSFHSQTEAEQFADQLRARGHKSYTVLARVPGRGEWWRVRVGPFSSQHAALAYRASFEAKEHVVPFVVPPASKDKDKDAKDTKDKDTKDKDSHER